MQPGCIANGSGGPCARGGCTWADPSAVFGAVCRNILNFHHARHADGPK
ncbi:unnamed protein product, partial [Larinioides sclopetarius]